MGTPMMIGRHRVTQDGDLVSVELEGPLTRDDIAALRVKFAEIIAQHGSCYMISDMTSCTTVEPAARKFMADWSRDGTEKVDGTAVHGVSFTLRALVTLAINAVRFIGKHPGGDLVFVKDRDEALRWISMRRAELAARG